jgi:polysaccharide pyruvyl transferase WcaK-like protein
MFEIHGAGFENRGAQLMLRTVIETIRRDGRDATDLCIEAEYDSNYRHMAPLSVRLLFPLASRLRPKRFPYLLRASALTGQALPEALCRRYGLVRRQDTQGLIDISGYSFGDKFPVYQLQHFCLRAEQYAARGKPVILLPQMLGPFTSPDHREQFQRLGRCATRIYAREQVSYDAALEVLGSGDKLRMAPDITIYSSPVDIDPALAGSSRYCCIVPNEKVLQKGDPNWKTQYVDRLVAAAELALSQGIDVRVVVHESGGGDKKLAEQIVARVPRAQLFDNEHAGVLKSYIAGARFLIGSRFHSIVAAFSRGVPAVAIGWAHKYDLLAQDFGVSDLLHNANDPAEHLLNFVRELSDDTRNEARRVILRERKEALRPANTRMWDDALQILGLSRSTTTANPQGTAR